MTRLEDLEARLNLQKSRLVRRDGTNNPAVECRIKSLEEEILKEKKMKEETYSPEELIEFHKTKIEELRGMLFAVLGSIDCETFEQMIIDSGRNYRCGDIRGFYINQKKKRKEELKQLLGPLSAPDVVLLKDILGEE